MTAAKKKRNGQQRPIVSAGGIVLRGRKKPLIAIVQLRRQKTWVLPKGKLHKNETVLAAARREAIEETGRAVWIHEYLGQIAYRSRGRPKVAKFWRMEAHGKQGRLMRDVQRVQWLPLDKAVAKLSRTREREFLERVGARALASAAAGEKPRRSGLSRALGGLRSGIERLRLRRYLPSR